ncbi:hypothetical protein OAY86_01105 [Candidatus Pelagibacter sp.]|nr:hypothetical protein [Candidatus Pelagibacter sp.]
MIRFFYNFFEKYKIILLFFLTLLSIISLGGAFYQAQLISFDFHFSPTKLVADGINHYEYILDGNHDDGPDDKIMYDQNGVYAQGLFIILIPFTYIGWDNAKLVWSILNIILAILIPLLLCKKFDLSKFQTLLIVNLFLISTVFRIHIGYGQQTLLTLFFLILPFINNSKLSVIFSGISFFKFNIGYALFLYFLSLKKIKNIVLSAIPCIIGWLVYCLLTDTNLIKNLIQPLQLLLFWDEGKAFPVTFFSLLKNINNFPQILTLVIPLILNFLIIIHIKKFSDNLYKLSILCLSALAFMPHQIHDYVLLVPLLIFSIKNFDKNISKINIIFIFYFFYFLRIISFVYGTQPWEFPYGLFGYFNNLLTISILCINLLMFRDIRLKN